jgi:hypothetical protein
MIQKNLCDIVMSLEAKPTTTSNSSAGQADVQWASSEEPNRKNGRIHKPVSQA